eukprot:NODE_331_length_10750_cov_0.204676.p5 type:complete len:184 gc:universal NODE_331_length_10750_cov_0.204676:6090-6641(+)
MCYHCFLVSSLKIFIYLITLIPMPRQLPTILLHNPKWVNFMFKLGSHFNFCSAMWNISLVDICATSSPFCEHFSNLMACFIRYEVGGDFTSNSNFLALGSIEITHFNGNLSSKCAVRVVNCFIKSIAFKPLCPKAGPNGGAADSLPAGNVKINLCLILFQCWVDFTEKYCTKLLKVSRVLALK